MVCMYSQVMPTSLQSGSQNGVAGIYNVQHDIRMQPLNENLYQQLKKEGSYQCSSGVIAYPPGDMSDPTEQSMGHTSVVGGVITYPPGDLRVNPSTEQSMVHSQWWQDLFFNKYSSMANLSSPSYSYIMLLVNFPKSSFISAAKHLQYGCFFMLQCHDTQHPISRFTCLHFCCHIFTLSSLKTCPKNVCCTITYNQLVVFIII